MVSRFDPPFPHSTVLEGAILGVSLTNCRLGLWMSGHVVSHKSNWHIVY
jgi:hypothetical protein